MHTNGGDRAAQLAARIEELERAVDLIGRELRETWRPRLLDVERDVERLLDLLSARSEGGE